MTDLTRRQAAALRDLIRHADYLTEATRDAMKARLVDAGYDLEVEYPPTDPNPEGAETTDKMVGLLLLDARQQMIGSGPR
jgi:hypothetical protein